MPKEYSRTYKDERFNVTVTKTYNKWRSTYVVVGAKENLDKWFDDLCDRYHPCGYGTSRHFSKPNENGLMVEEFSHLNSCD